MIRQALQSITKKSLAQVKQLKNPKKPTIMSPATKRSKINHSTRFYTAKTEKAHQQSFSCFFLLRNIGLRVANTAKKTTNQTKTNKTQNQEKKRE